MPPELARLYLNEIDQNAFRGRVEALVSHFVSSRLSDRDEATLIDLAGVGVQPLLLYAGVRMLAESDPAMAAKRP